MSGKGPLSQEERDRRRAAYLAFAVKDAAKYNARGDQGHGPDPRDSEYASAPKPKADRDSINAARSGMGRKKRTKRVKRSKRKTHRR